MMHAGANNTELMKQHMHYAAVRERIERKSISPVSMRSGSVMVAVKPPVENEEEQELSTNTVAERPEIDVTLHYRLVVELNPTGSDSIEAKQTLQKIVSETCQQFGTTMKEMISERRARQILLARQVAMWKCRTRTDHSTPRIGRFFNRDHTTILHAVRKIDAMIAAGLIDKQGNVIGGAQ